MLVRLELVLRPRRAACRRSAGCLSPVAARSGLETQGARVALARAAMAAARAAQTRTAEDMAVAV